MKKAILTILCIGIGVYLISVLIPREKSSVTELRKRIPDVTQFALENRHHLDALQALESKLDNSCLVAYQREPTYVYLYAYKDARWFSDERKIAISNCELLEESQRSALEALLRQLGVDGVVSVFPNRVLITFSLSEDEFSYMQICNIKSEQEITDDFYEEELSENWYVQIFYTPKS